jgi:RNA-directed DNA polymerase
VNTSAPLDVALATERVLGWQTKLHRWAGQDEQKPFGDLFDLLCDPATLLVAWERVKRNRGSKTAGVDGQTRWHVEQRGVENVLGELRQSLKDGSYTPLPVREHEIPKRGSGKVRKLGIPALRDRIVQMATTLVLEPIWEAEFQPCSYGFRPNRRAQDAIEQVRFFINPPRSYEWAIEGDVEDCFGSIHQGLLMEQLRRRVTDKRVLRLIRQFLGAGIMRHGSLTATPSGTPQGAILSPLLANVALSVLDRRFEDAWNACTPHQRKWRMANGQPSYRMIRYADDFVILVRGTKAQAQALKEQTAEFMREQMRLTLSPEKTHITHVDDGSGRAGARCRRYRRSVSPTRPPNRLRGIPRNRWYVRERLC